MYSRTQGAQAPNKDDPTTCFSDMKVTKADCTKALGGIVYTGQVQGDKLLMSGETIVQSIAGNCNVQIYKKISLMLSKAQIESSVEKIMTSCSPQAGSTKLTGYGDDVLVKLVNRAPKGSWQEPYDPDFPLEKPACLAVAGTNPIDQADCAHAARLLPTVTVGDYGAIGNSSSRSEAVAQFKTCQVKVSTSDGSQILARIADIMVPLIVLHQQCHQNWGVLAIKGALGPNGRTYVQVTSIAPVELSRYFPDFDISFVSQNNLYIFQSSTMNTNNSHLYKLVGAKGGTNRQCAAVFKPYSEHLKGYY
ncbi:hypothetical protein PSHT_05711 [Puccinia striiformis]|uniref:Uncharacterized protein n=1 Tax=Puccinia striiformis TaxID=27350 RepID=A0A2S4W9R8_9BASI|nr:hypothetical protein PSHT_05711 [Puccinia striiformis]